MIYPRSNEYRAAFQYIQDTLIDEVLKEGQVKKNALGPQVLSGNFAYIFEVISKYRIKYAVRCFQYDIKDRKSRYKAISKYLKMLKSEYFLDFEYQDEGIIVGGVKYPIVKMVWAEGELLGDFIKNNHTKRVQLKNLLSSIQKLAKFIEKHRFAHGDIQPGNIIVSNNGKSLKLIDYDGMYIGSLKNFGNAERGTPNFQHPHRDNAWTPKLDRFSFISLYVSLLALLEKPHLWDETDSDAEVILFREQDFANPKTSHVFRKLGNIASVKKYAAHFEQICAGPFFLIPPLSDFVKKNRNTTYRTSIIVPIAIIAIFVLYEHAMGNAFADKIVSFVGNIFLYIQSIFSFANVWFVGV